MFVILAITSHVIAGPSFFVIASEARQSISPTEIASSPRFIGAPRNDRKEVSLRY